VFRTIQGEGPHVGRSALFVRMSGCNVWSGLEKDRKRDTKKGFCAAICDTKFRGIDKSNGGFTAESVSEFLSKMRNYSLGDGDLVVFTGGEPMLQLSKDDLLQELCLLASDCACDIQVETNGSVFHPVFRKRYLCLTTVVSPKPPMPVDPEWWEYASAIKLLWPMEGYKDPNDALMHIFRGAQGPSTRLYLQPLDVPPFGHYGSSDYEAGMYGNDSNVRACVDWVKENPNWRLSVQVHKYVGLPLRIEALCCHDQAPRPAPRPA